MKHYKGIIHVHSNFSYDGRHSLEEIVQFAKERGYSFVGMSEHSDTLNPDIMLKYVNMCHSLSTPELIIIPGIEFSCDNRFHIIGLGIVDYFDSTVPLKVLKFIQEKNKVAIIAHPRRYDYKIPIELGFIADGIEVWNVAYDGVFVPNSKSLTLIEELRKNKKSLLAFGGQDLHRITKNGNVKIGLSCSELEINSIINALKCGDFMIDGGYFKLNSKQSVQKSKFVEIYVTRQAYIWAKRIRDRFTGISIND